MVWASEVARGVISKQICAKPKIGDKDAGRLPPRGEGGRGVKAKFIIHNLDWQYPFDGMGERNGAWGHVASYVRQTEGRGSPLRA